MSNKKTPKKVSDAGRVLKDPKSTAAQKSAAAKILAEYDNE